MDFEVKQVAGPIVSFSCRWFRLLEGTSSIVYSIYLGGTPRQLCADGREASSWSSRSLHTEGPDGRSGCAQVFAVFFRWQIFPITWNSWKSSLAVSVWIGVRLTEWRWRCRPADTGQFLGPLIVPVFSGLATIHADGPWQMLLSAKVVQLCLSACIAEQTGEKQEVCNCGRHSHWCVLGPGLMGHFAHDTITLCVIIHLVDFSEAFPKVLRASTSLHFRGILQFDLPVPLLQQKQLKNCGLDPQLSLFVVFF